MPLSAVEKRLLGQAAGLLTDKTDSREQRARSIIEGVLADKERDGATRPPAVQNRTSAVKAALAAAEKKYPKGIPPAVRKAIFKDPAGWLRANSEPSTAEKAKVIGGLALGRLPNYLAAKAPGDLNMAERMELAKRGLAMPDGSFPIRNMSDLVDHAMFAFGRAGDKGAVKQFMLKRARALGASSDVIKRIEGFSA